MNHSFMALDNTARYSKYEALRAGNVPAACTLRLYVYTDCTGMMNTAFNHKSK